MEILTEILGNVYFDPKWKERTNGFETEYLILDQWTAQKSRFVLKSDKGNEYAVSLEKHNQLVNGDIISFLPEQKKVVIIKIELSPVLVINLDKLIGKKDNEIIHTCIELGHALGNQHWPAVVKDTKIYIPLTVDKKVMLSVMHTHAFENISYDFQSGEKIIPYLAPHEIRRLFGGTGPDSEVHHHNRPNEYKCTC